ncbi:MAG TPA: IS481 family transposase [Candidatus Sulfotelmatobacter sp.]|nr:IS481 family transposase [Candidatus Sulfotelmatobacter sp.]
MDLHQNARLSFRRREELVQLIVIQKVTLNAAAAAFNVSRKTAAKWARRYRQLGQAGLYDRSSRPHQSPRQTQGELIDRVLTLRRQRWTGVRIAQTTALSPATVSRILRRHCLSRTRDLQPTVPVLRYEHPHPGDLLHLDTKKLARIAKPGHRVTGNPRDETRGAGWEMLHVAIDDHSRIAFTQLHPNERAHSSVAFLRAAVAYYQRFGIRIRRVLTDNAPCYYSDLFAQTCRELGIRHLRTRPYTPRTNGKAERFIQTALREWAYARLYLNSHHRRAELDPWLHQYNWHRPHASLGQSPPISRSGLDGNNLLMHHI